MPWSIVLSAASAVGSRSASCCCSSRTCCCSTSRRNHLRRRVGAVAGSAPRRRIRAPVLAVTHDRYFLDNVAQWILELDRGTTHPYEGNYSTYLDTKKARLQIEGRRDAKRAKHPGARAGVGAVQPEGPAGRRTRPRLTRYEELADRGRAQPQARLRGDQHPAGPAARAARVLDVEGPRPRASATGCSFDGLSFHCRAPGSSASSARTASAKSTLFQDDRR